MNVVDQHFDGVWFIAGENNGRYPSSHSVYVEGAGVLIDPSSDRKKLLELREKHGVREVWLSHVHEDHIKYLDLFEDVPLVVSRPDAPSLTDLEVMLDAYDVRGETRDYWRNFLLKDFNYKPREPERFFCPGGEIALGAITVEIIATPGHTPGHVSFFFREPKILFLADYDLTRFGPWYGDVHSSINATLESIRRLRKWPADTWLTSHETGVFQENPGELWDAYLDVIRVREDKLLRFLEEPRTFEEIINSCIVYWKPREPAAFFDMGERGHMRKHLSKLMVEGRIFRKGKRYIKV